MTQKFGIRLTVHAMVDGFLNVTAHWCTATLGDLDAGRLPVSMYPTESYSGVTSEKVKRLIESRIKDFPNCRAIEVENRALPGT